MYARVENENPNEKPICAVYARVSIDRQEESVDHQVSLLREFVKQKNIGIIPDEFIYEDVGVSATKNSIWSRPAMKRLLQDADRGLFNIVLFKGISRFARSTEESLSVLNRLKAKGLRVISYEENYDSAIDDSNFTFTIHSAVAEYEAEKIAIRVRLGNKEKAKQGLWTGPAPFGYELVNRKLVVNPEEAEIVKKIFKMYVDEGKGATLIARELKKEGIKTRSGNGWYRRTIMEMIKNEAYTGKVIYNRQTKKRVPDYDNLQEGKKKWVFINNKKEDWVIVENAHEPIIDESTFKRAQEIISKRAVRKDAPNTKHPLVGLAVCKECGANLHVLTRKSRKEGHPPYRYYVCNTVIIQGRDYCSQPYLKAEDFEDYIISTLSTRLKKALDEDKIYAGLERVNVDREKLEKELAEINRKIDKVNKDTADLYFKREEMTDVQYEYISNRLKEEMTKLVERKNHIELELSDRERSKEEVEQIKNYIRSFLDIDINDTVKLRMLLQYFIDRIEVQGNHINIYYKFNF